jgi:hypothetical protein
MTYLYCPNDREMSHYHEERNHQGLENHLLRPLRAVGEHHARVKRHQRLGGMLSSIIAEQLDQRRLCLRTLRGLLFGILELRA